MIKMGNLEHPISVSQSLNIMYHAPAALCVLLSLVRLSKFYFPYRGERLRIIGTTLNVGARALTARAEVCATIII